MPPPNGGTAASSPQTTPTGATMLTTLIKRQIATCESFIKNFEDGLPYADGPAFRQDRDRIRELKWERELWKKCLAIVTEQAK